MIESLYFNGLDQILEETLMAQLSNQYLLKYLNPDTNKMVACYKIATKVYKAEINHQGFD